MAFLVVLGNYVSPVPAQQRLGKHWYLGSADAIYQTINIIEDVQPDIVVIVGADHVYRMDFGQMVEQHIESGAEFTVAGIRQPLEESNQFGVINVDPNHPNMIREFQEKPATTEGLPDDPNSFLASMGNYGRQHGRAVRCASPRTRRPRTPSTTWAATSRRTSPRAARPACTTSTPTSFPLHADRPRLLARRGYDQAVL